MRILISGSSGLIGSALRKKLVEAGHELGFLVRRQADHSKNEVYWDAERGSLDRGPLAEFAPEAVIHLAGENVGKGRWNARKKAKIRDSRVKGTAILAQALASLSEKPRVFLCASASGYYGSRGDEVLDESAASGDNFLAGVCGEWEAACEPARAAGIRVVNLRTGIVLSKKGGALPKILTPFRFGVGGIIGNGRQYMSWIDLEDEVRAILWALEKSDLSGPVNLVAPNPVTNRVFTKTLGRVLFRPTCFPLPASTARMIFGEKADELLLAGARIQPKALLDSGFEFRFPKLKEALKHVLKN